MTGRMGICRLQVATKPFQGKTLTPGRLDPTSPSRHAPLLARATPDK
jgi:hypothetical protein